MIDDTQKPKKMVITLEVGKDVRISEPPTYDGKPMRETTETYLNEGTQFNYIMITDTNPLCIWHGGKIYCTSK